VFKTWPTAPFTEISMAKRIRVEQDAEKVVSTPVLAQSIVDISESLSKLRALGLNQRAIVVLIQNGTNLSKRDIRAVLDSMDQFRGWYCK